MADLCKYHFKQWRIGNSIIEVHILMFTNHTNNLTRIYEWLNMWRPPPKKIIEVFKPLLYSLKQHCGFNFEVWILSSICILDCDRCTMESTEKSSNKDDATKIKVCSLKGNNLYSRTLMLWWLKYIAIDVQSDFLNNLNNSSQFISFTFLILPASCIERAEITLGARGSSPLVEDN